LRQLGDFGLSSLLIELWSSLMLERPDGEFLNKIRGRRGTIFFLRHLALCSQR
jgi:hypothetical protein